MTRPHFTVRNMVLASGGTIVVVVLWLCATFALEAQGRREAAQRILVSTALEDRLHEAAHAWAAERSLVQVALNAPEAVTPSHRAAIEAARRRADGAIDTALAKLRLRGNGARRDELVAQTEARLVEIRALRTHVDEQLGRPKAAREGVFREAWFPAITELIMASHRLRTAGQNRTPTALREIEALRDLRQAEWVMSEFAEREVAFIAGIIAAAEPLVLGELMQLPAYRGRFDQAWTTVEAYAREPDSAPEVVAALEGVRRGYFDAYERLRRRVVTAGTEGTEYPLDASAWLSGTAEAIAPIRALGDAAGAEIRRLAARQITAALVQFVLSIAIAVATAALGAFVTWLVVHRVVRPIDRITHAMRALASGDQTAAFAANNGFGEMGEMARAVQVVRESMANKSREIFEANEALRRLNQALAAESERLFSRLAAAAAFAGQGRKDSGTPPIERERILLVEGEGDSRDLLAGRLAGQGYRVMVTAGGDEALRTIEAHDVDLVLLEPPQGGVDGFALLSRLKSESRLGDVPVLVLPGGASSEDVRQCIEAGAEDYLPPPSEPALLMARIEASLERKRRRDHEAALMERLAVEKARFDELVVDLLSRQPVHHGPAPAMPAPLDPIGLSEKEVKLKRELQEVLAEADERRARNQRLTTRNLAEIMERSGRHRLKAQTLRKIIDRRYPPLYRLGILGPPQKD